MKTNTLKDLHLCDAGMVRNGNRLTEAVGTALCSRMPYRPASVTIMEMQVEHGIADSITAGIDPMPGEKW